MERDRNSIEHLKYGSVKYINRAGLNLPDLDYMRFYVEGTS